MNEPIEIDGYEPDYHNNCVVCNATPTVIAVKDGEVVEDFKTCGPCMFGSADALDPDNW